MRLNSIPCDNCGTRTKDPTQCPHGWEMCPQCPAEQHCTGCARGAAEDAATDRALTAHFEDRP